jgi:hypothetical protein
MASSSKRVCTICCEEFTKFVRKPIECPTCHHEACMKCCQTYLTSTPNRECMMCHAPWIREFVDTVFPKAWVRGTYATFRQGVLMDIERARLPTSQHLVQNYKISLDLKTTLRDEHQEKQRIQKRIREIDINTWNITNRIRRIRDSRFHSDGLGNEDTSYERRAFIRACPVDGCRGFLSSALKCGTCDAYACGQCLGCIGAERDAPHECDPNDIETAKFIKKESRPCPTCAINISKINGCDQMYCVQCRTAFSWRTGIVVTGTIHNPHYFEMLRNASATGDIPRQPGDDGNDECHMDPGRLTLRLYDTIRSNSVYDGPVYDDIMKTHRHACHLHRHTIPDLRGHITDTSDLRLQYLLGTYDEATFRRKLVLRETATEKYTALVSCYEARVHMTIDAVRAYLRHDIDEHELVDVFRQVHHMMTGFLQNIRKRFTCSVEFGHIIM